MFHEGQIHEVGKGRLAAFTVDRKGHDLVITCLILITINNKYTEHSKRRKNSNLVSS